MLQADIIETSALPAGSCHSWATLLLAAPIPAHLAEWIVHFDARTTDAASERTAGEHGTHQRELKRIHRAERRYCRDVEAEIEQQSADSRDFDAG
jgi:hypothetical protein